MAVECAVQPQLRFRLRPHPPRRRGRLPPVPVRRTRVGIEELSCGWLLEEERVLIEWPVIDVHELLMADRDQLPPFLPQRVQGGLNGVQILIGPEDRVDPSHKESSWQTRAHPGNCSRVRTRPNQSALSPALSHRPRGVRYPAPYAPSGAARARTTRYPRLTPWAIFLRPLGLAC